jgi:hypothetical protein
MPTVAASHRVSTAESARPTRVRHTILWLTVAAYMITYMDRVAISSAAPLIQKEFGFSMVTMGGSCPPFAGVTRCSNCRADGWETDLDLAER